MKIKNFPSRFFKKSSEHGAATIEAVLFGVMAVLGTFATIEAGRYFYAGANACSFAESASDELQNMLERGYVDGYYKQDEFLTDVTTLNAWAQNKLASNPHFHLPGAAGRADDGEAVPVVNSYNPSALNMLSVLRNQEDYSSEWTAGPGGSVEGEQGPPPIEMEFGGVSGTVSSSTIWQHPEATTTERHSTITPFYLRFKAKHQPLLFSFIPNLKSVSCIVPISNLPWAGAIMENRWGGECVDDLFGIDQQASCEMWTRGERVCYWDDTGFSIEGWSSCKCICYSTDNGGSYRGPAGEVPPDSDCSPTGPMASAGCPAGTHWDVAACACVCDAPVCGDGYCPNPKDACNCEGPMHTPMKSCAGETFTWDAEHCWWVSNQDWTCPPMNDQAPYPICCAPWDTGGEPQDPPPPACGACPEGSCLDAATCACNPVTPGSQACMVYTWNAGSCSWDPSPMACPPGQVYMGPPNCCMANAVTPGSVTIVAPEPNGSQACIDMGGTLMGPPGMSELSGELGGAVATDCNVPGGVVPPGCTVGSPVFNPMTGQPQQTVNCP